jgi:hypothetical protein
MIVFCVYMFLWACIYVGRQVFLVKAPVHYSHTLCRTCVHICLYTHTCLCAYVYSRQECAYMLFEPESTWPGMTGCAMETDACQIGMCVCVCVMVVLTYAQWRSDAHLTIHTWTHYLQMRASSSKIKPPWPGIWPADAFDQQMHLTSRCIWPPGAFEYQGLLGWLQSHDNYIY